MSVPYVTKVIASVNMSRAESSTEVSDAFQQAIFQIEKDAKERELEVAWGSGKLSEEGPYAYASIMESGPWLTFDAIGRK